MLSQEQIRYYWSPRCTGPWATISLYGAGRVTVRAAIVSAVKAFDQILEAYGYRTRAHDTGAYNCRLNTSGTAWSMHAYAVALDINWLLNPYSSILITDMRNYGDGLMPERICAIRTNNGRQVFNWGGFWNGNKDAMHFEIVCTPADLRTGINWATVYSGSSPTPVPEPDPEPEPTPEPQETLMYKIAWIKGADAPGKRYRILFALGKDNELVPVEAYNITDDESLKRWRERLDEIPHTEVVYPANTFIRIMDGPYKNVT